MIVKKPVMTTVDTTVVWNNVGYCDSECPGYSADSVWCSTFGERCIGTCDGTTPAAQCRAAVYAMAQMAKESEGES